MANRPIEPKNQEPIIPDNFHEHLEVNGVKFGITPEWLLDADISPLAMNLYGVISCKHANRETGRFNSTANLAGDLRRSKKTVAKAMRELIDLGAVRRHTDTDEYYLVYEKR